MKTISRICVIGAGTGGLLFASLLKKARPGTAVTVIGDRAHADQVPPCPEECSVAHSQLDDYAPDILEALRVRELRHRYRSMQADACHSDHAAANTAMAWRSALLDLLADSCSKAGVEMAPPTSDSLATVADDADFVVVERMAESLCWLDRDLLARPPVAVIGEGAPALPDAMVLFDAMWNEGRDLQSVLDAFACMRRAIASVRKLTCSSNRYMGARWRGVDRHSMWDRKDECVTTQPELNRVQGQRMAMATMACIETGRDG